MTKRRTPAGRTEPFEITVVGEAASKANSRKIVKFGARMASIKSDKARAYAQEFERQCPVLDPMFLGDCHLDLSIFYNSRRPDLDESLILDLLQGRVYANDRQVRSRTTRWGLDPGRARTVIRVRLMTPEDFA